MKMNRYQPHTPTAGALNHRKIAWLSAQPLGPRRARAANSSIPPPPQPTAFLPASTPPSTKWKNASWIFVKDSGLSDDDAAQQDNIFESPSGQQSEEAHDNYHEVISEFRTWIAWLQLRIGICIPTAYTTGWTSCKRYSPNHSQNRRRKWVAWGAARNWWNLVS